MAGDCWCAVPALIIAAHKLVYFIIINRHASCISHKKGNEKIIASKHGPSSSVWLCVATLLSPVAFICRKYILLLRMCKKNRKCPGYVSDAVVKLRGLLYEPYPCSLPLFGALSFLLWLEPLQRAICRWRWLSSRRASSPMWRGSLRATLWRLSRFKVCAHLVAGASSCEGWELHTDHCYLLCYCVGHFYNLCGNALCSYVHYGLLSNKIMVTKCNVDLWIVRILVGRRRCHMYCIENAFDCPLYTQSMHCRVVCKPCSLNYLCTIEALASVILTY